MVKCLKMQMGEVAMKEMSILQAKDIPGGLRMSDEVAALFDAKKNGLRLIEGACQDKLPYPTADVQDPDAADRNEEFQCPFRHVQGSPVLFREIADRLGVQMV